VLRWWREFEGTRWGAVLLGNVWPAYLFALPLGVRIWNLAKLSDASVARVLQELSTIIFLGLVVVLFAVRRRTVHGPRAAWHAGLIALVGTFLLNIVGYLPVESTTPTESLLASTVIIVAGTLFTTWSLAVLGRCFGIMPEARGLVVRGPYRWVRHPVYFGELVSALGMVVAKPHPLVLAMYAAFVLLQYWRTLLEERALARAFPADYPPYRARVPRLVPGWR
jgi:protein-S-isoprenylcysteine O-methyltransferase Ste14